MNAYELADALEKGELIEFFEKHTQFWKVAVVKDSATMLRQQADRIAELEKGGCGNCHACLVGVMENNMPVTSQRMIVCSDCGNKRCPKASTHRHKCTGSNEVGQYGSIYTAPRDLS